MKLFFFFSKFEFGLEKDFNFQEGNSEAVEILFSYFDKELKNKQIQVLSNFPETIYPDDTYAKLLPRIE